jgi:hypothetical protein
MEVDKDEYTLEISDLWSEKKVESVANAAKGRSDRKEVDRGGFFSERTDKVLRAQIETILKDWY